MDSVDLNRLIDEKIETWWKKSKYKQNNFEYLSPSGYVDFCLRDLFMKFAEMKKTNEKLTEDIKLLIKREIDPILNENKRLKDEIERLRKGQGVKQELNLNAPPVMPATEIKRNTETINSDNTIDSFNQWAKDPRTMLPSQFNYADGDLRLREKQTIRISNSNSMWITNKSGLKKYLFPNPGAIDQIGGDIDVIYTVSGTRRAKGQNRVFIQKACEIKEDGWIEYKGALSIL